MRSKISPIDSSSQGVQIMSELSTINPQASSTEAIIGSLREELHQDKVANEEA